MWHSLANITSGVRPNLAQPKHGGKRYSSDLLDTDARKINLSDLLIQSNTQERSRRIPSVG